MARRILLAVLVIASFLFGFELGKSLVRCECKVPIINATFKSIRFPIVAVDSHGNGVLEYATLKIIPGHGNLYLRLNPFVEPDTQYSFETAVSVACRYAHEDCSKYDFILEIHSNAILVGGPSAGAAIALATYLLLENKTWGDYAVTGAIEPDGTISQVGGILQKAEAAYEHGYKIFFVPKGQSKVIIYKKVVRKKLIGPFIITTIDYVPEVLDLNKYFKGMKIIEVKDFGELVSYVMKPGPLEE